MIGGGARSSRACPVISHQHAFFFFLWFWTVGVGEGWVVGPEGWVLGGLACCAITTARALDRAWIFGFTGPVAIMPLSTVQTHRRKKTRAAG